MLVKAGQEAPAGGVPANGCDTESHGTDGRESAREGLARDVSTNAAGAELSRRLNADEGSDLQSRR